MNGSLQQALPQQSINEILALLSPETRATLAMLADPLHPLSPLSLDSFLKHLLARAPVKLIQTRSAVELAHITSRCLTALTRVASEHDRITIDFSHDKERGALCLALDDHPFIISSIAEALSDADIKVEAFLHPIVLLNGTPIALSYIEIAAESMERVSPLIPRLRDNLLTLTRVGRDFAPMKALASTLSKSLTDATYSTNFGGIPRQELAEFLDWLNDGCFFFLGAVSGDRTSGIDRKTALGIWHASTPYTAQLTTEVGEDLDALSRKNLSLSVRKLRLTSRVHRHATVVHILVRPSSSNDAFSSFVGYLTSKAWAHESHEIPIVRRKVEEAIAQESVVPNSHDYKYIVEVIDNMPTDEALAAPTSELINLARLALGVFSQEETRSVTTVDEMGRRALTVVALPPERYSAVAQSRIQSIIESTFDAEPFSSEIHIDSIKKRQFRLYISTPLPTKGLKPFVTETLAEAISKATLPWSETLRELAESTGKSVPPHALFPETYQAATEIPEALHDLSVMNALSETSAIAVSLYTPTTSESSPTISLFSRHREISISLATPVLENVGLEVLSAHS